MLTNRIIGAFTFRKGVYAEVEQDNSFTQTAWILVVVVAFLSQLGVKAEIATTRGIGGWLVATALGTLAVVIGFAVAAAVIPWIGRTLFKAETNFPEMVRVLGLANVWIVVGVIGLLALISPTLVCILSPLTFIVFFLGLAAWLIAAKEALDLDWFKTLLTMLIGWVVYMVITSIVNIFL